LGLSSRAIIGMITQGLAVPPADDWSATLAMLFDTGQNAETIRWLGNSPTLREWIGGRQAKGLRKEGVDLTIAKFEATLELDADDVRYDRLGQVQTRIADLVRRGLLHWRSLLNAILAAGTAATYGYAYDGHVFFDSDHASGDSGTQKNLLTNSEVAALDVTVANPTQAEIAAALLGVISYMAALKDDAGEPAMEDFRKYAVMPPPSLWGQFASACTKDLLTGAAGAVSSNPLAGSGFSVRPILNARLTGTTVFYVFCEDMVEKPFIKLQRGQPLVSALAEGSEQEFHFDTHQYGIMAERAVGYGQWRGAAHCTLS
jgi:phage major head subunit gpT-like protein